MKATLPTILTVREVATYLRLHVVTIYRMAQSGTLPAFRVGRAWRFKRDQIEQWLLEHQTNNSPTTFSGATSDRARGRRR